MIGKTFRSRAYLSWVRKQPCIKCGVHPSHGPVSAHHVKKFGCGGIAIKPADTRTIPLCQACCHPGVHQKGEEKFLGDPILYVMKTLELYVQDVILKGGENYEDV
jgi:hypothetical protein